MCVGSLCVQMTNVQNKLCFSVWPLGQCVHRTLGQGGGSGSPGPSLEGSVQPAVIDTCRALAGVGQCWALLGFAGLGEGSRGCSSPCLCWHCCLPLTRAVQGHGLCPCASTSHFLHRSSLAATDTSLTLRPESRHRVGGRQQMSSVLMCSFQYK